MCQASSSDERAYRKELFKSRKMLIRFVTVIRKHFGRGSLKLAQSTSPMNSSETIEFSEKRKALVFGLKFCKCFTTVYYLIFGLVSPRVPN